MANTKGRRLEAGKVTEKSKSFHGRSPALAKPPSAAALRRPKTQPELFSPRMASAPAPVAGALVARPTKVLVNVTVKGWLGALHLLISPEATVGELVAAAVLQYQKEGRRPLLPCSDAGGFDLHYSQFCLESLDRDSKMITLGSRNFFLCPKPAAAAMADPTGASCSRHAGKASPLGVQWQWLVDLLL